MTTTRSRTKRPSGRGELRADAIYPLGVFLRRLGIGRHSLTALRRQGLPVRSIGPRLFIDGSEALATLRRLWGADEGSDDPAGSPGKADRNAATIPDTVPNATGGHGPAARFDVSNP
jgi:hypothetical protein